MSVPREIPPASPHLLRVLLRQNDEAMQGMRSAPPVDIEARAMTMQQIADQSLAMAERLDWCRRNPPPPRRRRTWRDIPASGSWRPELPDPPPIAARPQGAKPDP